MFCGIDVGLKRCVSAVINERNELIYIGDYDKIPNVVAVGIDAPLSFPKSGYFRKCEKELLKMGIRIIPPIFLKRIALRGIEIAEKMRSKGIEVFEVYPYATRVILNIAPRSKKRTKNGCKEIEKSLSKYVPVKDLSHDELDAVISALTVKLYYEGKARIIKGSDGSILVPI